MVAPWDERSPLLASLQLATTCLTSLSLCGRFKDLYMHYPSEGGGLNADVQDYTPVRHRVLSTMVCTQIFLHLFWQALPEKDWYTIAAFIDHTLTVGPS